MLVVLAPDSFKGASSAPDVCRALARGVRAAAPQATVREVPMADGGEGTLDCLLAAWGGARVELTATGPLGAPVAAHYGLSSDATTAVVEVAVASGLALAGASPDAGRASSRGTGELAADALRRGAREIVVCLGGSAMTDGGTGLLRALGMRFLDAEGRELAEGGADLVRLASIDEGSLLPGARAARWRLACDVTLPMVGPTGAAHVFGPQKGAGTAQVEHLDAGLRRLAEVLHRTYGIDVAALPGAGAAGGTAGGLVAALGGRIERGAELVADVAGLSGALEAADLVLTGEGRLDEQTAHGKVVAVVATRARNAGVPAVALCGQVVPPLDAVHAVGLSAAFSIADGPRELDAMVDGASALLSARAEQVVRLFACAAQAPSPGKA
ncbi:glycerate kinase [Blastococcus sp. SYSU DS1024]